MANCARIAPTFGPPMSVAAKTVVLQLGEWPGNTQDDYRNPPSDPSPLLSALHRPLARSMSIDLELGKLLNAAYSHRKAGVAWMAADAARAARELLRSAAVEDERLDGVIGEQAEVEGNLDARVGLLRELVARVEARSANPTARADALLTAAISMQRQEHVGRRASATAERIAWMDGRLRALPSIAWHGRAALWRDGDVVSGGRHQRHPRPAGLSTPFNSTR